MIYIYQLKLVETLIRNISPSVKRKVKLILQLTKLPQALEIILEENLAELIKMDVQNILDRVQREIQDYDINDGLKKLQDIHEIYKIDDPSERIRQLLLRSYLVGQEELSKNNQFNTYEHILDYQAYSYVLHLLSDSLPPLQLALQEELDY